MADSQEGIQSDLLTVPVDQSATGDGILMTADNQLLIEAQTTIEVNGEKHTIISQAIDQNTGETLVILASESGNHFALPISALTGGITLAADAPPAVEEVPPIVEAGDGDSSSIVTDKASEADGNIISTVASGDDDTQGSIPQSQVGDSQGTSLETVSVPQEQPTPVVTNGVLENDSSQPAVDNNIQATIGVQDNQGTVLAENTNATLQAIVAGDGGQYVIMTEDGTSAGQINLADVLGDGAADGQTFVVQSEEPVVQVAPSKPPVTQTQIITEGMTPAEEAIVQAISASGNLTEGQIIHCVQGNVTIAYQIGSTSNGELSLIQLGPVTTTSSSTKRNTSVRQRSNQPAVRMTSQNTAAQSKKKQISVEENKPKPPIQTTKTFTSGSGMTSSVTITRVETGNKRGSVATVVPNSETTSLLTGTLPGPTQLASSRRTYSKKNILWVNPESTNVSSSAQNIQAAVPALLSTNADIVVSKTVVPVDSPQVPVKKSFPSPTKAFPVVRTLTKTQQPVAVVSQPPKVDKKVVELKKAEVKENNAAAKPSEAIESAKIKVKESPTPKAQPHQASISVEVKSNNVDSQVRKSARVSRRPVRISESEPTSHSNDTSSAVDLTAELSQTDKEVNSPHPAKRGRRSASSEKIQPSPTRTSSRRPTKAGELPSKELVLNDTKHLSDLASTPQDVIMKDLTQKESEKISEDIAEQNTDRRRSSRVPKKKIESDFVAEPVAERSLRRSKGEVSTTSEVSASEVDSKPEVPETEETNIEEPSIKTTPKKRVGFHETVVADSSPRAATPTKRNKKSDSPSPIKRQKFSPNTSKLTPILKPTNYTPRGKRLPSPIICSFSPLDRDTEVAKLRESISSISDSRRSEERYDTQSPNGIIHVRIQSPSLSYTPGSEASYSCQKCGFRTSRMNNLVNHHKEQCPVVRSACMLLWQSQIRNQQSTPTTARRHSEFSSPDEESEHDSPSTIEAEDNISLKVSPLREAPHISDEDEQVVEPTKNTSVPFEVKDVVWVECDTLHWPGMTVRVNEERHEVTVKLIEGPASCKRIITVSLTKVFPFNDADKNKRFILEGRNSQHGHIFVKAIQKAEDISRKKVLGESHVVRSIGDLEADYSEHSDEDIGDQAVSPTNKTGTSEGESTDNDTAFLTNPQTLDQWKERRKLQNAKLLACVKEGKVENHLLAVFTETIPCERHKKFKIGTDKNPNLSWFGPIDDEDQQEEIYDYCNQLFKANFKTDAKFDSVAYLFEVWVPEAIVKAISRVRRIDMKEAEEIFARGVILSRSEKDELEKEIRREQERHTDSDGHEGDDGLPSSSQ